MRKMIVFAAAGTMLFMLGCGGTDSAPVNEKPAQAEPVAEAPKPINLTYEQVFDKGNDGQLAIIEGYLQLPNMMYTSGESAQVDFHARPYQRHGRNVIANITTGSCNNCMAKLGEKYQLSDLKMKADDGVEVLPNQRVRLTGKLSVYTSVSSEDGLSVSLNVTKIEKIPEIEIDYSTLEAVKIGKENLFDTTLNYAFSMAEGKIGIPSMLFMENDVTLDLPVGGKNLAVNFSFGTGPNQIEPVPSNYTNADFKIHDHKGNLIKLGKSVKVWGTRSTPKTDYPGILYVEHVEQ